jgi:GNAT superfamily N-acetyltransferase
MTSPIRFVHAGDLTTDQAHALVWNVGEINERHQEIAIVGDKVIGAWTYGVGLGRHGKTVLHSGRTDVTPRQRRKGVAVALWIAGIRRWKPRSIESTIGSDEGRDFLAHMTARLAYFAPGLRLYVKTRAEDNEIWESHCNWSAQQFLRSIGEREIERAKAKQIETKPIKLLKGAAA